MQCQRCLRNSQGLVSMSARDCFSGNRYKISKSYGKSPNVVQKEYVGNHQKSFIVPLLHSAHTGLDSQLALYQTRPFLQSILQAFVLHLAVWNEAKTYFSSSVQASWTTPWMPGYKGPLNLNSHIFSDGAFGQGRCNFDTLDSNTVSTLFPILHSTIKQNTTLQTAMEDD